MSTTKKWSDEAWQAALPTYNAILELPFLKELAAGTLPMEKFIFYLRQDAIYIENYCKVLASIASRVADKAHTEAFLHYALDGVSVEKTMHETYLAPYGPADTEPSPTCLLYMSMQGAQATAPVEVQAAAILPCFWVYLMAGRHIAATATADNPFAAWIATYSDPSFDVSNQQCIDICDALAEKASPEVRRRMTEVFVLATKMEWMFWNSAYKLEQWEI